MATYAANYLVRGLSFEVFKILPSLRLYTMYKGAITISSFFNNQHMNKILLVLQ